jgi:hypothetical protein
MDIVPGEARSSAALNPVFLSVPSLRSSKEAFMTRTAYSFGVIVLLGLVLAGCGAVSHEAALLSSYVPERGIRIEVGKVTNATGQTPTVDDEIVNVEQLLAEKLTEKLRGEDFLWAGGPVRRLVLNSKIIEYEPGDAFKRWLLPGWGSTVVTVEGELRDEANTVVGTVRARRTVSFGGVYTIGAWRTIFSSVADDMVSELRSKIPK